ncbi:MAG: hypothetical protein Q8P39_02995 [Candidatus Yanofskybacteria bacterium]|nr:hypothetical protein [Candidatus Yanofskybacteria bacterium]
MMDIIPKEHARDSLLGRALFFGAILILLATLGVGLVFTSLASEAEKRGADLERQLTAITTPEERALEQDVLRAKRKTDDFSSLLSQRKNLLGAFRVLEDAVHPQVIFTSVDVRAADRTVQVSGRAAGFIPLEQQLQIFKTHEDISAIEISSFSLQENGTVEFAAVITLPARIFSSL